MTISDSCTGLHDDSDDRMVTAAGTFNSVQLAFTHILSHAGAVGPDANPVMGLAGGDPDCVANVFRLLIPHVKAGGLIGRGGCTIKAIRELSSARIEISSHAYHFHPVHGPLSAPSTSLSSSAHASSSVSCGGNGAGGDAPRRLGVRVENGHGAHGFGSAGVTGTGSGGDSGSGAPSNERSNIVLPPPILMDRVMTTVGSFDACLRAHHLVASKLMDVRPSPVPMPPGPPTSSSALATSAAGAFISTRTGNANARVQGGPLPPALPRVLSSESARGVASGRVLPSQQPAGITVTASTSPASSASEHSSCHRHPWDFEDRSWKIPSLPSSPLSEGREGGGRDSVSSSPDLASSSSVKGSPESSSGSIELSRCASDLPNLSSNTPSILPQLSLDTSYPALQDSSALAAIKLHAAQDAIKNTSSNALMIASTTSNNHVHQSNAEGRSNKEELPACLADIIDSFLGGNSNDAPAPRSPSTITGIDVEVGRAAFALLGVRDLDDIKHLSGAGIIAPESPEAFRFSDEVLSAAAAVLSVPNGSPPFSNPAAMAAAARGEAPADGSGLAAVAQNKAVLTTTTTSAFSSTAITGLNASGRKGREILEAFSRDAGEQEIEIAYRVRESGLNGSGGGAGSSIMVEGGRSASGTNKETVRSAAYGGESS